LSVTGERGTASEEPIAVIGISCRPPGTDAQPEDRERVVAMLQAALSKLGGRTQDSALTSLDDLDSDEDMFQFIDKL
jgi:acyl transferase domain-containing protein